MQDRPPMDFLAIGNDEDERPAMDFLSMPGIDMNLPFGQESYNESLLRAPGRIIEDIGQLGARAWKAAPEYWEKSKTEVPGIFQTAREHPLSLAKQGLAGLAELGEGTFNAPHNIIKYLSERLNLVPQNINEKVQMARMPEDTQEMINATFGTPQYPGEAMTRGIARNVGSLGATAMLNPASLLKSNKSIVKNIIKPHDKLENKATKAFNEVSKEVNKRGITQVSTPNINIDVLQEYFPKTRQYDKLINEAKLGDYNALRKIQSDLYTGGKRNLGSSFEADRLKGAEMLEKRNDINQAISDHLIATKNHDLANKLNTARKDWRTLQDIYYNENMNNAIINMVDKNYRKIPKDIKSILKEESIPMKKLLEHHIGLESKLRKDALTRGALKYAGIPAGLVYAGYKYGLPYLQGPQQRMPLEME